MRQLVARGPRDVRLQTSADTGAPGPHDVHVRSTLGLISSGTERRIYLGLPVPAAVNAGFRAGLRNRPARTGERGRYRVTPPSAAAIPTYPTGLGYNTLGVVEAIGRGVAGTPYRVGDRVMTTGPHADPIRLAAWAAVRIPDPVPDEQAILAYLATLGLSALRRIDARPGQTIVVQGLGIVGVTAALVAAASGLRVIATDLNAHRRNNVIDRGAVAGALDPTDPEFTAQVEALVGDGAVDHVIETAGSAAALATAVRLVRRRGSIAVLALHTDSAVGSALAGLFHEKECALVSCANDRMVDPATTDEPFTIVGNLRFVLDLLATGRLDFGGLLTHVVDVADAPAAYRLLEDGADPTVLGIGLRWGPRSASEADAS